MAHVSFKPKGNESQVNFEHCGLTTKVIECPFHKLTFVAAGWAQKVTSILQ